ncbi:MAG: nucleotidyltransferase domain-containing protein [Kiritimatiellae bacterium]|nr:nucleotidyltransferase domain-containing protein [Kiritimatiellia bacterium]
MNSNRRVLNEAVRRLVEGFHPEMIILFGSRARGSADRYSDFDLMVICSEADRGRTELQLRMDRALRGLRLARDIVVLSPKEFKREREIPGTIARPAWLEGKILYEQAA